MLCFRATLFGFCGGKDFWISCLWSDVVRNLYDAKVSASSYCNRALVEPNSDTSVAKMIPTFWSNKDFLTQFDVTKVLRGSY